MRKFRNIPALVTLLAGFVSSVVMIIQKYSLYIFCGYWSQLWQGFIWQGFF